MSVIPFKPLGAVVIVIPHANAPERTPSGIQIADVYDDAETSGTIVAVGSGFCCAHCEAQRDVPYAVGDRVLFTRGAGVDVDGGPLGLTGERFVLLQESELLAVVDPAAVCEVV